MHRLSDGVRPKGGGNWEGMGSADSTIQKKKLFSLDCKIFVLFKKNCIDPTKNKNLSPLNFF